MTRRHVTPEGQTRDPNALRAQYLENSWRCYLATISNYYLVCCELVRSAIPATAWLLALLYFWARYEFWVWLKYRTFIHWCCGVFAFGSYTEKCALWRWLTTQILVST